MLNLTISEIKCLERAERIYLKIAESKTGTVVNNPDIVKNIFRSRLITLDHEQFHVMYLDNQHKILSVDVESKGTIDSASVYPREIVKKALHYNAAAIILAHNHPSGAEQPSSADINITNRIRDAVGLLDIRLLDHIIIAGGNALSFAEKGLLN